MQLHKVRGDQDKLTFHLLLIWRRGIAVFARSICGDAFICHLLLAATTFLVPSSGFNYLSTLAELEVNRQKSSPASACIYLIR